MNSAETKKRKDEKSTKETPLMAQYNSIKSKYPDALLLFRVGDFYETFGEDAVKTSAVLGIVLTKRANGAAASVDLAGFPYHALDIYLPKLVRAGYRVAICDQLEDPKLTKTIVKRGVSELVTPGVTDNDRILENKKNNFLAAVYFEEERAGLALLDISTGEFFGSEGSIAGIEKQLQSFKPSEVLYSKKQRALYNERFGDDFYTYALDEWVFQFDHAYQLLTRHFQTQHLKGFGIDDMHLAIIACGAALQYLSDTEHPHISHITSVSRIDEEEYVWLDRFTVRNLEIVQPIYDAGKSLLSVLDHTLTPMGSRLMRRWLLLPLKDIHRIKQRQAVVGLFHDNEELYKKTASLLKQIGDLERLIARVPSMKISPREMLQLLRSLDAIEQLKQIFESAGNEALFQVAEQLNACNSIRERIRSEIRDDAPASIQKGGVIKSGVNAELDELNALRHDSKNYLIQIQQREIERTGITSLKISFNNVFGYYLEVTNTHKNKVPADWTRKQTLANAERYITDELKQYEEKILNAEEKILQLETQLYQQLVLHVGEYIKTIQLNAALLARIDCLLSFAYCALQYDYHCPEWSDDWKTEIKDSRHPVIERMLPLGEHYVPNDVMLDNATQQLLIITGPNMSGKSALIRQVALIQLMAQCGSYVPASYARLSWVDKIFTRVGASDNISSGESTFMVEMSETASILNNITHRSLVILDEIGRGTATFDGISIAWSIAEYLHNNTKANPKTLFATHYHELSELEEKFSRIKNYNVSIKESGNKVIFLRKLEPGSSQHSFGIHVARMAGMPGEVVDRAYEILKQMESKTIAKPSIAATRAKTPVVQLDIFDEAGIRLKEIEEKLNKIDINTITPIEALLLLQELKKMNQKN
jgi:DNA mismatch repair protein MutS